MRFAIGAIACMGGTIASLHCMRRCGPVRIALPYHVALAVAGGTSLLGGILLASSAGGYARRAALLSATGLFLEPFRSFPLWILAANA